MKRKLLYIGGILLVCCMLVAIGMTMRLNEEITTLPAIGPKIAANIHYHPQMKDSIQKPKPVVKKMDFNISGTLLDTDGKGVTGVIVSDGYHCVKTDSSGRYKMKRDSLARFIYYSVPADCEVPTHSETDRTACFYQAVSNDKKKYDFTLTRLPGGKEVSYKMIVIGDPQVTNAYSPYYTSPDDNPIKKSDVERFTTQTMADIKQTIKSLPAGTPVYGLSMGDDVQYYGGYNAKLERQIRQALGSSEMRLFSVIGNHDRREARAAEADHAAGADGVEKVLHRLELRGLELGIGFLLAVGGDDDGLHEPSAGADLLADLLDRARDARVHGRGHEAAGFADQLADPDAVAGLDDRDGGRADVHGHRDLHRLGNGQAQRSQLRGVFAVRHVYAVDV